MEIRCRYDTVLDMRLNVLFSIYIYVGLSVSVTCFLLFEALVAD